MNIEQVVSGLAGTIIGLVGAFFLSWWNGRNAAIRRLRDEINLQRLTIRQNYSKDSAYYQQLWREGLARLLPLYNAASDSCVGLERDDLSRAWVLYCGIADFKRAANEWAFEHRPDDKEQFMKRLDAMEKALGGLFWTFG